jgi:two-component system, sensor histidine kinase and response regulator
MSTHTTISKDSSTSTLRAEQSAAMAAPLAPHGSGRRRYLYCLLAEDNPIDQTLAVHLLEKGGHKVVVTSNGKEALAAFERESFDIVLMDVRMPEMDGFDTIAAIRERERRTGSRVPIIAMTGYAIASDRERWLEAGMDAYLAKPIDSANVCGVIENLVTLSGQASETDPPAVRGS